MHPELLARLTYALARGGRAPVPPQRPGGALGALRHSTASVPLKAFARPSYAHGGRIDGPRYIQRPDYSVLHPRAFLYEGGDAGEDGDSEGYGSDAGYGGDGGYGGPGEGSHGGPGTGVGDASGGSSESQGNDPGMGADGGTEGTGGYGGGESGSPGAGENASSDSSASAGSSDPGQDASGATEGTGGYGGGETGSPGLGGGVGIGGGYGSDGAEAGGYGSESSDSGASGGLSDVGFGQDGYGGYGGYGIGAGMDGVGQGPGYGAGNEDPEGPGGTTGYGGGFGQFGSEAAGVSGTASGSLEGMLGAGVAGLGYGPGYGAAQDESAYGDVSAGLYGDVADIGFAGPAAALGINGPLGTDQKDESRLGVTDETAPGLASGFLSGLNPTSTEAQFAEQQAMRDAFLGPTNATPSSAPPSALSSAVNAVTDAVSRGWDTANQMARSADAALSDVASRGIAGMVGAALDRAADPVAQPDQREQSVVGFLGTPQATQLGTMTGFETPAETAQPSYAPDRAPAVDPDRMQRDVETAPEIAAPEYGPQMPAEMQRDVAALFSTDPMTPSTTSAAMRSGLPGGLMTGVTMAEARNVNPEVAQTEEIAAPVADHPAIPDRHALFSNQIPDAHQMALGRAVHGMHPGVHALAEAIYGEARNQPFAGQVAVANAVANRAATNYNHYGTDLEDQVYADKQFSFVDDHNLQAVDRAQVQNLPGWQEAVAIANAVARNQVPDNTYGATSYRGIDRSGQHLGHQIGRTTAEIADHSFGLVGRDQAVTGRVAHGPAPGSLAELTGPRDTEVASAVAPSVSAALGALGFGQTTGRAMNDPTSLQDDRAQTFGMRSLSSVEAERDPFEAAPQTSRQTASLATATALADRQRSVDEDRPTPEMERALDQMLSSVPGYMTGFSPIGPPAPGPHPNKNIGPIDLDERAPPSTALSYASPFAVNRDVVDEAPTTGFHRGVMNAVAGLGLNAVSPGLAMANTVSGLVGGPTAGGFLGKNSSPANLGDGRTGTGEGEDARLLQLVAAAHENAKEAPGASADRPPAPAAPQGALALAHHVLNRRYVAPRGDPYSYGSRAEHAFFARRGGAVKGALARAAGC
jgi:hypothetical protein